ncbi:MAG: DUF2156 domain-containing protein [Clostridiaceae bacterium]|nr:DUF2156 domain-containing protein [Clostridiaceae bacterium]
MELANLSGKIFLGEWTFNVIELSDIDLYSDYIRQTEYTPNLWTSNFPLLWAISQSRIKKILWKIIDDMLVTFGYLKSGFLYLICLPVGKGDPEAVSKVVYKALNFCNKWNVNLESNTLVKVVNSTQLDFLRKYDKFNEYFKVVGWVGLEKHFSIDKLVSLPGKEFESIRRKINKFHRLYPTAKLREYENTDFNKVMDLGKQWSNTAGEKYSVIFDNVYFYEIIKNYSALNHLVLVVEMEDKIIGMVSGGALPTGQSWWCLSKFMNDYNGLSEVLIIELAKVINKRNPSIEFMNAGEDLGPGGLRIFKQRFKPVMDLRRYAIYLR